MSTALLRNSVSSTVVLKFCRRVDVMTLCNSMKTALAPRMTSSPSSLASLETFSNILRDMPNVEPHTELVFHLDEDRTNLHIVFKNAEDGKTMSVGTVKGREICDALLDVYIGESPIVSGIKDAMDG